MDRAGTAGTAAAQCGSGWYGWYGCCLVWIGLVRLLLSVDRAGTAASAVERPGSGAGWYGFGSFQVPTLFIGAYTWDLA